MKQAEAGLPIKELCRKGGFSDATFYKWRARFGGMEVADAKRLRDRAGEWQAQAITGRSAPGHACTQECSWGKALAPQVKREAIGKMIEQQHLSERRACRLVGLTRDAYRNPPVASSLNRDLSGQIIELAHVRRRFGYRRAQPAG